jgi:hypothetical protein
MLLTGEDDIPTAAAVSVARPRLRPPTSRRYAVSSSAKKLAAEIAKEVHDQLDRTINIPDGLTEDQAVAHVIDAYRKETGVELPEADVRAEVREQMEGRETT